MPDNKKRNKLLIACAVVLLLFGFFKCGSGERKLIKQLASDNADERFAAIRGLEASGSTRARDAVAKHIGDPDPRVAGRAVLAMGNMGQSDNVQVLVQATTAERTETREAAVVALGRYDQNAPVDNQVLVRTLQTDPSPTVRGAAAVALGHRKVLEAVPVLLASLNDPDSAVRGRCCGAIQEITGRRIVFPHNGSVEERQAAIANLTAWWQQRNTRNAQQ